MSNLAPFSSIVPSSSSFADAELELALNRAEESMRRLAGQCRLQKTAHPDLFCSILPSHWRSNKSLPSPFVVLALFPVPDGTRVSISAGNDDNWLGDVKNGQAEMCAQCARFSDLRFVGKSGRGKNFNLTITIFTQPMTQFAVVPNVLKVTVDGPRESRNASKYCTNNGGQFVPRKLRSSMDTERMAGFGQFSKKMAKLAPQFMPAKVPSLQPQFPPPTVPFPLILPQSTAQQQALSIAALVNGNSAAAGNVRPCWNSLNNALAAKLVGGALLNSPSSLSAALPSSPPTIANSAQLISAQSAPFRPSIDTLLEQHHSTQANLRQIEMLRFGAPPPPFLQNPNLTPPPSSMFAAAAAAAAAMFAPSFNSVRTTAPASLLSAVAAAAALNARNFQQSQQQQRVAVEEKLRTNEEVPLTEIEERNEAQRATNPLLKRFSAGCSSGSTSPPSISPKPKRQKMGTEEMGIDERGESDAVVAPLTEQSRGKCEEESGNKSSAEDARCTDGGGGLWRPFHPSC